MVINLSASYEPGEIFKKNLDALSNNSDRMNAQTSTL